MSKNLDERVRLQSEIRGERLQGIAEGASSAPRLASSSAAWFPGRNECAGTHCSLIEQEREDRSATEFESFLFVVKILNNPEVYAHLS